MGKKLWVKVVSLVLVGLMAMGSICAAIALLIGMI